MPWDQQITSLRLKDSGPCRAWTTLHTPPISITKDFTLCAYEGRRKWNLYPEVSSNAQQLAKGRLKSEKSLL
ncbi:Slam Family Member 9 [Manis pentadactyla]|nr:Slam Family Member 9 [Manis pentadactyla]